MNYIYLIIYEGHPLEHLKPTAFVSLTSSVRKLQWLSGFKCIHPSEVAKILSEQIHWFLFQVLLLVCARVIPLDKTDRFVFLVLSVKVNLSIFYLRQDTILPILRVTFGLDIRKQPLRLYFVFASCPILFLYRRSLLLKADVWDHGCHQKTTLWDLFYQGRKPKAK